MAPPGSAITWLVIKTATLNYSLIFWTLFKNLPRTCCLSESCPLPAKSTLNGCMIESMMSREKASSTIAPEAYIRRVSKVSHVKALPTMMLLRVSSGSRSYLLAMALILSGLKVFSVSMNSTFPWPPPWFRGNYAVTHRVMASWDLPVLNSPKASVID